MITFGRIIAMMWSYLPNKLFKLMVLHSLDFCFPSQLNCVSRGIISIKLRVLF